MNPYSSDAVSNAPKAPRNAWVAVGLLWIAFLINYTDRSVVFPIFPALQADLGFTSAQLGLVGSLFLWSYALCQPLVGRLADVIRREHLVVVSLVLLSLATLASGLSGSVGMFLWSRVAFGITAALYVPAAYALIVAIHPVANRSKAFSLHGTAQLFGIVLGGWYGGWMADNFGWRLGFIVLAAAGLLYAPGLWAYLRKLPRIETQQDAVKASPVDVFRSYSYWALMVAFFAFCLVLWMIYGWLPTFIYEKYRVSMAESGLAATLYLQVSSGLGVVTGGWLADRLVRRVAAARFYLVGIGLIVSTPFAYLTLTVDSLDDLKLASAAFGFLSGVLMANFFPACYDVIAERNYGFGGGFLNMVGGWSGGAGILLAGRWKESVGIESLMGWAVVAAIASGVLLIVGVARSFQQDRRLIGLPAEAVGTRPN